VGRTLLHGLPGELVEGRRPDHSTLCGFRKKSRQALKDLFGQVGRLAMGLVRLGEVALDGTRIKANASRSRP